MLKVIRSAFARGIILLVLALTAEAAFAAAPTADAGPDQTVVVLSGEVTLDGSASADSDGSISSYAWTTSSGVSLTGADTVAPTFDAPATPGTLTFSLIVTDNEAEVSVADTVDIIVTAANVAPTADAGPDQTVVVLSGEVTLDGSASADSDGSISSYAWTTSSGVSLTGADTVAPTFDAPATPGTLTFSLIVTDNEAEVSVADTVDIIVTAANVAPTADAGPDQTVVVLSGEVTLDGSASADSDGSISSYAWTTSSGVSLTGADTVAPTFDAPATPGTLTFSLIVTDNEAEVSVADTVDIIVTAANVAPTADAGPDQTVVVLSGEVTLDGSASADSDGSISSYAWTTSSGVSLTGADTVAPTFDAPATPGTLTFSLIVTDNEAEVSVADTVDIIVTAANVAPTADAGPDQTVVVLSGEVTLDGSASADSDGSISSYAWTTSSGVSLTGADTVAPTFDAPATPGTLTFSLIVTDNEAEVSVADTVDIIVTAANVAPTADAGSDQSVRVSSTVTLNGSGTDTDGTIASYAWSETTSTGVTLSSASIANPTFTAPAAPATLTFSLVVTDDDGVDSVADSVTIAIRAAPNPILINRGNGLIYDPVLDITWLANANYAFTSGYIDTISTTQGDGRMSWDQAIAWAAQLDYAGFAEWRLPTTLQPDDPSCDLLEYSGNGNLYLYNCTGSEMGRLFYNELNAVIDISTNSATFDAGFFVNLQGNNYWSGTESNPEPAGGFPTGCTTNCVWDFDFKNGVQTGYAKTLNFFALAVHPGDIGAIPIADAGPAQSVVEATTVTLNGSGSTDNGTITSYAWTETTSTGVGLTGNGTVNPTFTAPVAPATLIFSLVVTDDDEVESTNLSTVTITVTPPNVVPTANAGPAQSVIEGTTVTLSGSGSTDDGTITSYAWTETTSTGVGLTGNGTVNPTFTAPAGPATVTFSLVVTDNEGAVSTNPSTVTITVTAAPNIAPTADAGPAQSVVEATTVTLNGSGSTDDGTITSYAWVETTSTGVGLTGNGTVNPTFTAPAGPATVTFSLVVTDNEGAVSTNPSTVTITVTAAANVAPTAEAGPDQGVVEATTVTLNGSGTDTDGTIVSYAWTETTSTGVTLSSTSIANPTFTAPVAPATVTFSLVVTDDDGDVSTNTSSVTITVAAAPNVAPTANAGLNQTVVVGTTVTLNGGGSSDSDGTIDSNAYVWTQTAGTTVSLANATTAAPTFTAPSVADTLSFSLVVTDNEGADSTNASSVTITVTEGNLAPLVILEADQGSGLTHIVSQTDGSQAIGLVTVTAVVTDPNSGDTHSYDWSTTDNALVDTDGDTANGVFSFDPMNVNPGFYTLRVVVNDGSVDADAELMLKVVAEEPLLSTTVDRDNDGIVDADEGYGDADNDGVPNYLDAIALANVLQGQSASSEQYLLQTESGLNLALGLVAFQANRGQAVVSSANVVNYSGAAADEWPNVGGLFDFVVTGLPEAGQSIRVVLPQLESIPVDAVFRKLMPTGWQDFVENSRNALSSAHGVSTYCPPPDASAYTPGLTEGHRCVQLFIEDGGPNDADIRVNRRVVDPGGLVQRQNVVSVKSSGGAIYSSLILLILWRLWFRLRRKVREIHGQDHPCSHAGVTQRISAGWTLAGRR